MLIIIIIIIIIIVIVIKTEKNYVITGNTAEWACETDQCINITARCDFVSDCRDASDEHNCSKPLFYE